MAHRFGDNRNISRNFETIFGSQQPG